MDTTHLTQKNPPYRPGRLSLGRHTYRWCGRPCCSPCQASSTRRPDRPGSPPSHLPSDALHHILRRLDAESSNSTGNFLTLLPDNPPNFQPAAPTQVSLTSRSSQPPDPPTAISDRRPQACIRRMQHRRLHSRTPFNGCAPADGMQTTVFSLGGLYFC